MPGSSPCSPLLLALLVAACGGADENVARRPTRCATSRTRRASARRSRGVRPRTRPSSRPPTARRSQELADAMTAGPSLALATSIFTTGDPSRMAFGDDRPDGKPVYGPTAIYVAPDAERRRPRARSSRPPTCCSPTRATAPSRPRRPRTRSPRSTPPTSSSPSAASTRCWSATKRADGKLTGATSQVQVSTESADPIPRGRRQGAEGPDGHAGDREGRRQAKIDTRDPPSDMHEVDFADVVGKKPVALLFATPQLCASRVCGPVDGHRAAAASPSTATRWSSSTRRSTSTTT